MNVIIKLDEYEKCRLIESYRRDMEYFSKKLLYIETMMPLSYLYKPETNELTRIVPPEYQKAIDHVMKDAELYAKSTYPQLFENQYPKQ